MDDATLLGGVGPDASEAISLKLQVDRKVVTLAWVLPRQAGLLALDAKEFLDVVA